MHRGGSWISIPSGTQQRVLHRDIKSSNILLDENWNAKISDMGLSKFGPANQQYTFLVSNAVGTIGYCDPLYVETGLLTKESDVYSFGVVLFEVLCGRLCIDYNNGNQRSLTKLVRQCYERNKMNDIIYCEIKDEINPNSLKAFVTISYQYLKRYREERPLMTEVVKCLESALRYQRNYEEPSKRDGEEHLSIIGSLASAFGYKDVQQEVELSLIGIDNAGKTSLVNVITLGEYSENVNSTVGFNLRKTTKGKVKIKIWDLGGQARYRSMWERYCRDVSAIGYVVDATDPDNLCISKAELNDLLSKPSLSDIPLLVLGNKIDEDGALTKQALTEQMGLSSITNREVCCFMISCKNSENIDLVIEWLVRHPKLQS